VGYCISAEDGFLPSQAGCFRAVDAAWCSPPPHTTSNIVVATFLQIPLTPHPIPPPPPCTSPVQTPKPPPRRAQAVSPRRQGHPPLADHPLGAVPPAPAPRPPLLHGVARGGGGRRLSAGAAGQVARVRGGAGARTAQVGPARRGAPGVRGMRAAGVPVPAAQPRGDCGGGAGVAAGERGAGALFWQGRLALLRAPRHLPQLRQGRSLSLSLSLSLPLSLSLSLSLSPSPSLSLSLSLSLPPPPTPPERTPLAQIDALMCPVAVMHGELDEARPRPPPGAAIRGAHPAPSCPPPRRRRRPRACGWPGGAGKQRAQPVPARADQVRERAVDRGPTPSPACGRPPRGRSPPSGRRAPDTTTCLTGSATCTSSGSSSRSRRP